MAREWMLTEGGWRHTPCGQSMSFADRHRHKCPNLLKLETAGGNRPDPGENQIRVGRDHPWTSHAAAARALPRTGTIKLRLLQALKQVWPEGLTDEEMQEQLHISGNSQRQPRGQLAEGGWIRVEGSRRTHAGNQAQVWVYVPE